MKNWGIEGHKILDGKVSFLLAEGTNSYGDGPARYVGYFEGSKEDAERICDAMNMVQDQTHTNIGR